MATAGQPLHRTPHAVFSLSKLCRVLSLSDFITTLKRLTNKLTVMLNSCFCYCNHTVSRCDVLRGDSWLDVRPNLGSCKHFSDSLCDHSQDVVEWGSWRLMMVQVLAKADRDKTRDKCEVGMSELTKTSKKNSWSLWGLLLGLGSQCDASGN